MFFITGRSTNQTRMKISSAGTSCFSPPRAIRNSSFWYHGISTVSPRSVANAVLITLTLSPRLASKPTASCTRRVKRASSSALQGARVVSPVCALILT
ncbi:hypothetical protein D3C84_1028710 [compost metagenome]